MRTHTSRPAPKLTTAHLALQDSATTLCDEPLAAGRPSAVVCLYVPVERMQSLRDGCPLCKAVARRLQAASPVLTLRIVMAHPASLAPREHAGLRLIPER